MSGKIHIDIDRYDSIMNSLHDVPGDFAEFGVWYGRTFDRIYAVGLWQSRTIHAVDSFIGMPRPQLEGDKGYVEGTFSVGGGAGFRSKYPKATVHEGFIPDILHEMNDTAFAFAHIDLDHEYSTRLTLDWLWSRMVDGGIVICHDWWPDADKLAAKAINEWMSDNGIVAEGAQEHSIWFVKHGA
jgi:hypothetical protein